MVNATGSRESHSSDTEELRDKRIHALHRLRTTAVISKLVNGALNMRLPNQNDNS